MVNKYRDYKRYLEILTDTFEDRLDTKIAYYKGLEYENKYYGYNYVAGLIFIKYIIF